MRTFSEKLETREFQALSRSKIVERCTDVSDAILTELTKLTYLNSIEDQPHWKDVLAGLISRNSIEVKGGEFDYSWFFEDRDTYDEQLVISIYDTLPSKYDRSKIVKRGIELDSMKLLNNIAKFRKLLTYNYVKLGRFLNLSELHQIINQLDLYK